MANNHKLTLNEFIKKANCIHDNRYDYSLVDSFLGTKFKLNIICKKHGSFMQTANSHLCGQGCPRCKVSIGESKIINFLNNNKIEFIFQKRFKECKSKRPLPFDFYLPNFNLCIEYDGRQHYHSHNRFDKSIKDLEKRLKHDNIKNVFCQKPENPNLLRISYLDFNKIEKILKENLNLYNLSF